LLLLFFFFIGTVYRKEGVNRKEYEFEERKGEKRKE
jgi:hypothetical protein